MNRVNLLSIAIRIGGFLCSAGQTVLLARMLGAHDLGVYSAILAFATVVYLAAPTGMGVFLFRESSRAIARGNMDRVRGLRSATFRLGLAASSLASLLLGVLMLTGVTPSIDGWTIVLVMLLAFTLGLDPLRSGIMRGMGSALQAQLPEILIRPGIFTVVLLGVYLLTPGSLDVNVALLAYNVAGLIALAYGNLVINRWVPRGMRERITPREVIGASVDQTIFSSSQTLMTNLEVLVLSALSLTVAAGQLRVALLGVVALLFIYNAIAFVSVRDIGVSLAKNDDLPGVLRASDRLVGLGLVSTAAITATILLIGEPVIAVIFGEEYRPASGALSILAIGHVLAIACGPSFEIVRLLDSRWFSIGVNLATCVVLPVLTVALLPVMDPLFAVAIASAMANVLRRLTIAWHVGRQLGADTTALGAVRRRLRAV
ncbi:oligosaccharide flippase family protein [Micrococcus sp. 2A]|uniref:oligosaccharide flippase family protein n=1 Tax=unclassified Micrococcus TaxID=2620948 RepID=UPI002006D92B|nr:MULTISPECIES: oligosaccharide flippase family protein [unclassified Micrococcus]MCK6095134.1 oligosaccharide flippase family protein [Micrococcus sp. EYE_212]MCK6171081.1 oligosaccharide flippase family protein [Micrococcus sp. EYE_162]